MTKKKLIINFADQMIDKNTVARILDAANIVDVVSDFVTLRKAGVNYKGICPFHDEKTPSFVVSPSKGVCKCFSCGKGGNPVHFIMEHEQMTYPEALRWLAKKYGIEIKERELSPQELQAQNERESMFILNEWARTYFHNVLLNTVDGRAIGMAYFRSRGFRDDIIEKFQLGFCLPSRDTMALEALKKGFAADYIEKTGLCYKTDQGQLHDRYHGRVIFPVHTISGKVVAFGGRVLKTGDKVAKYVNSPESTIYHKSNELYGIYFAKSAIVKQDRCFLVEGYTDVISMHQSGIENVVASSGTSLTSGQIRLIHRFTENLTILYDGDAAGIKASLRGIDMLLEEGMNIKVLLLPDGDDPDSFARKHNAKEYCEYIDANQVDFIRFKTDLLLKDCAGDPIKKASLIGSIVKSISVIPDAIIRSIYIKECSEQMAIEESLLTMEVAKAKKNSTSTIGPTNAPSPTNEVPNDEKEHQQETSDKKNFIETEEEKNLITAIIRYADMPLGTYEDNNGNQIELNVIEYIQAELEGDGIELKNDLYKQVYEEALRESKTEKFVAKTYFCNHPDETISRLAFEMISDNYQLSTSNAQNDNLLDENRLAELVPRLILELKQHIVTSQLDTLLANIKTAQQQNDEESMLAYMKRYVELKEVDKVLSLKCGDRVITRITRRK